MNRVEDKIEEIEGYTQELSEMIPLNFEEYKSDLRTKAACERYFEKIVEAVVDLSFLIIKDNKLKTPEEEKQSFEILYKNEIISKKLSEKMQDAKGVRNILAHEYGKIDDELVFDSIKDEFIADVEMFIKQIRTFLKK